MNERGVKTAILLVCTMAGLYIALLIYVVSDFGPNPQDWREMIARGELENFGFSAAYLFVDAMWPVLLCWSLVRFIKQTYGNQLTNGETDQ